MNDIIKKKISHQFQQNKLEADDLFKRATSFADEGFFKQDKKLVLEAIKLYKQVIILNSKYVDAYLGLASISFTLGQTEKSLKLLSQAQKLEPHNPEIIQIVEIIRRQQQRQLKNNNKSSKTMPPFKKVVRPPSSPVPPVKNVLNSASQQQEITNTIKEKQKSADFALKLKNTQQILNNSKFKVKVDLNMLERARQNFKNKK